MEILIISKEYITALRQLANEAEEKMKVVEFNNYFSRNNSYEAYCLNRWVCDQVRDLHLNGPGSR